MLELAYGLVNERQIEQIHWCCLRDFRILFESAKWKSSYEIKILFLIVIKPTYTSFLVVSRRVFNILTWSVFRSFEMSFWIRFEHADNVASLALFSCSGNAASSDVVSSCNGWYCDMYASNCLVSIEMNRINEDKIHSSCKQSTYRTLFLAKISFGFAGIIPRSFFRMTVKLLFSMCLYKFSVVRLVLLPPRHYRMFPSMPALFERNSVDLGWI